MVTQRDPQLILAAVRLLERVLRLYPRAFREVFAADMLITFRDQCRAAYVRSGAMGVIGVWLITSANVTWEAAREHTHSLARVGALAWMIGGALWVMLHLPIGGRWFPVPILALLLMLVGLACLLMQVSTTISRLAKVGFVLTGLGLVGILAGYMAALFSFWEQSGMPMLVGTALQAVGLFTLGLTLFDLTPRKATWQIVMVALALISLIDAVWLSAPIAIETVLHPDVWMVGVLGLGVIIGALWMILGATLWRGSQTEIGRIA